MSYVGNHAYNRLARAGRNDAVITRCPSALLIWRSIRTRLLQELLPFRRVGLYDESAPALPGSRPDLAEYNGVLTTRITRFR